MFVFHRAHRFRNKLTPFSGAEISEAMSAVHPKNKERTVLESKLIPAAAATAAARERSSFYVSSKSGLLPIDLTTLAEVHNPADIECITSAMGGPCRGQFAKGRFGTTHFLLEQPGAAVEKSPREVVLCAHGVGTNLAVYDDLAKDLLKAGFTVLRYEYFSHGWSKAEDPYLGETHAHKFCS